jgi:hypothetical protein
MIASTRGRTFSYGHRSRYAMSDTSRYSFMHAPWRPPRVRCRKMNSDATAP